jgi:hypothetical protein
MVATSRSRQTPTGSRVKFAHHPKLETFALTNPHDLGADVIAVEIGGTLLQQQDHQRTAQLLEYEIGSGENAALQTFAVETLPVVLQHLAMVQDLMEQFAQQNVTAGVAPPKGSGMPTPQTPNTPKN